MHILYFHVPTVLCAWKLSLMLTIAPGAAPRSQSPMATRRSSSYPMTPMADAWAALRDAVALRAQEGHTLSLRAPDSCGSILTDPVVCPAAVPSAPCSRLDGYALRGGQPPGEFTVVSHQRLGHATASGHRLAAGQAAYITTGAPLPDGADAVIGVEQSSAVLTSPCNSGDEHRVALAGSVPPGANVRPAGSDAAEGEVVLPAGHVLTASDAGLLLSLGLTSVRVFRRPRIGVLSTGDELLAAAGQGGLDPLANRIVDSNRPMLLRLVEEAGGVPVDCGVVGDSADAIQATLLAALYGSEWGGQQPGGGGGSNSSSGVDILITSGGVSMGDRDHVKPVLERLVELSGTAGGPRDHSRVLFGRLNMKPGKPAMCVLLTRPSHQPRLVVACPGNPVSAWVCFHILASPCIRYAMGAPWDAEPLPSQSPSLLSSLPHQHLQPQHLSVLKGDLNHASGSVTQPLPLPSASTRTRTPLHWIRLTLLDSLQLDAERPEFHRISVWQGAAGGLVGRSTGAQASSRLASTVAANAIAWLPRGDPAAGAMTLVAPAVVDAILVGPLGQAWAFPSQLADEAYIRVAPASAGGGCGCSVSHHGHPLAQPAVTSEAETSGKVAAAPSVSSSFAADLHVTGTAPLLAAAATPAAQRAGGIAAVSTASPQSLPNPNPSATAAVATAAGAVATPTLFACVLTVSDRCAAGQAVDASGPAVAAFIAAHLPGVVVAECVVVGDVEADIRGVVEGWVGRRVRKQQHQQQRISLIITTGGTGLGPRDVTPEALRPLITRPAHGLVAAMLAAGMRHTPLAALSRYEAGVIVTAAGAVGGTAAGGGGYTDETASAETTRSSSSNHCCLLIELPGSVKAVKECLGSIRDVLPHALALVTGPGC